MEVDSAEKVIKNFMYMFNSSIAFHVYLWEHIVKEHRYIQNRIISTICRTLYHIGKKNYGKDDRNRLAIELCETLARISDNEVCTQDDVKMLRRFFF